MSWEPLCAKDPIPGDPEVSSAASTYYGDVAEAMRSSAKALNTIVEMEGLESEAVEALREKADEIQLVIRATATRYEGASDALATYTIKHAEAQDAAEKLRLKAVAAQDCAEAAVIEQQRAGWALDEARQEALRNATPVDPQVVTRATCAADEVTRTNDEIVRLQGLLEDEVAEWRKNAKVAADALVAVVGSKDGLNDGWWENWGSDWAHGISTWAGNIAGILGPISLLVGWIPIVGQVVAVAALVAGALAFAADIALAAHEEGSWLAVGLGAVSLVTGVFGLRLSGVGKWAGSSAKVRTSMTSAGKRMASAAGRSKSPALKSVVDIQEKVARGGLFGDAVKLSKPRTWAFEQFKGLTPGAKIAKVMGNDDLARALQSRSNISQMSAIEGGKDLVAKGLKRVADGVDPKSLLAVEREISRATTNTRVSVAASVLWVSNAIAPKENNSPVLVAPGRGVDR